MHKNPSPLTLSELKDLSSQIKLWGNELGFIKLGITDTNLSEYTPDFKKWLAKNYHGDMLYMQNNIDKREFPELLVPNAMSVIVVAMNYLTDNTMADILTKKDKAAISRYAVGRDYHKLMRKRLQSLANKIEDRVGKFGYRAFVDSAPVLEKPLAEKAGLGWSAKNTLLINKEEGSWFFLGTLFTDLPLPTDSKEKESSCGKCKACINICPTNAIVAEGQLDARKCISYLTIENKGVIPLKFREAIGNRIYGCDDCQLICPWNRYAKLSTEDDFKSRNNFSNIGLLELFSWSEQTFLKNTEGSAIRRIGYNSWIRNIAVALGNAPYKKEVEDILTERKNFSDIVAREHILWALDKQKLKKLGHGKDTDKKRARNDRIWLKLSQKTS